MLHTLHLLSAVSPAPLPRTGKIPPFSSLKTGAMPSSGEPNAEMPRDNMPEKLPRNEMPKKWLALKYKQNDWQTRSRCLAVTRQLRAEHL